MVVDSAFLLPKQLTTLVSMGSWGPALDVQSDSCPGQAGSWCRRLVAPLVPWPGVNAAASKDPICEGRLGDTVGANQRGGGGDKLRGPPFPPPPHTQCQSPEKRGIRSGKPQESEKFCSRQIPYCKRNLLGLHVCIFC